MKLNIALLAGDGIGPEVIDQAVKVSDAVAKKFGHDLNWKPALTGAAAIDAVGEPYPDETHEICKSSDAVLFGAVGDPSCDNLERHLRPEQAVLGLRAELGLFANFRPATVFEGLEEMSGLRAELARTIDLLIIRELNGDVYFGDKGMRTTDDGQREGWDMMSYSESEVRRIAHSGFRAAQKRGSRLCSVDKANVLETSQLWRDVVIETAAEYPDVELSHMYADNGAMQLVRAPKQFDVIVTDNLFGDVLSDCAAMLTGSLGMLPSASLGAPMANGRPKAMYEPVHGSAPDITGQGKANPCACILSLAMALRYSFDQGEEATRLETAVEAVLAKGIRTGDLMQADGGKPVTTSEMTDAIIAELQASV